MNKKRKFLKKLLIIKETFDIIKKTTKEGARNMKVAIAESLAALHTHTHTHTLLCLPNKAFKKGIE